MNKPLSFISGRTGLNEISVLGMVSSLASSSTTFGIMDKMDAKGVVINSAFAVSGAFVVGSHLAFTMAFDDTYVFAVIVGKLISGVLAVAVAGFMCRSKAFES